jgi:hypothetical protein
MPPKYVSTFRAPSEYERQLEEARRRAMLAEALAQQEYQPMEGTAAPIPKAAPLVKALQSFMTARAGRQAEEAKTAAEKAGRTEFADYIRSFEPEQRNVNMAELAAMEAPMPMINTEPGDGPAVPYGQPGFRSTEYAQPSAIAAPNQRLMPVMGADGQPDFSQPMQMQVGGPLTAAQKRARALEGFESSNPMVQQFAMSQYEATMPKTANLKIGDIDPSKFTPASVAAATRTGDISKLDAIEKSEQKAPTVTGGKFYNYETKKWEDIPGYVEQQSRIAAASRGPESLVMVDVNGKPVLTPRSQAVGKTAFVNKPPSMTGDDKVDRRKHRETRIQLQNAYDSIGEFAKELQNTPKEASLYGEAAGRLSSKYKLALGAVRVLQNTGVLNPGELPFIEDTLRNPQSLAQLFNPASRETIFGQVYSIADLLEKQSATNDELFEYDITPLKGRDWRASSIPAKAKAAGLTQADWDAATEEERAAWR